ncbi:MAG: right-handed parallel beta-helix repeat-containing protein, partial [Planctomycetes bacterium]|nr:right-handed parallel beta-helix repeat-containing protein [Planctomycetota bacterium]
SAGKGGGIACNNADPNIINCSITYNAAVDGGGVYCFDSSPTFINCDISNNLTTGSGLNGLGGGFCNENNSMVTLSQCTINGNRARFGAAVFSRDSSLIVMNCLISGNQADSHGGATYCENSSISITNCTFGDNYAEVYGGAFRAFNNSTIDIANSVLWSDSIPNIDQRGSEIALGSNSSASITYCNIQGGPDLILREVDSTLIWDQTNIGENEDDDPLYAQSGYWDPNASALDTEDDFWVDGDYRLLPQSPCIDRGSNAALVAQNLDLDNSLRIINSLIDIGAYETGLTLAKLKIKAGKNRLDQPSPVDSFTISGAFDATLQDFLDNTEMQIYFGPYTETIPLELPLFKQVGDNPKFMYKRAFAKDEPGAITAMKFDLTKATFSLVAKNIDLTGLETPADVIIKIGDNDYYRAAAVGELIANAKKPVPIQFLMGQKDSLRIYKQPKFKLSTAKQGPGNDSLQIKGGISLANLPPNLAGKRVDIQWGDYHDYIPADAIIADSSGNKFIYKKASSDTTPNSITLAQFDFVKCTFKIVIKNADIGPLSPPQNLTISFEGFEATARPPYFR